MAHSEDNFTKKNGVKIPQPETEDDPSEILGDVLDDSSIGSNDTHGPIEIEDNDFQWFGRRQNSLSNHTHIASIYIQIQNFENFGKEFGCIRKIRL